MALIDTRDNYNQATLLAVGGHTDNGLDYADDELIGKITQDDVAFSILPHWGFSTDDFLFGGRPYARTRKPVELELPPLDSPRYYDSLTISGPRWFLQRGQDEEIWHSLYLNWRPCEEGPDNRKDLGLNRRIDIGLESPWTSNIGRRAKGVLVGQVISSGKLLTHLTLITYDVKNNGHPQDTVSLRPRYLCFEGADLPEELVAIFERHHMLACVQEAIKLFGHHCQPTNMGDYPPYWETLFEDLIAECWASTSHENWISASYWISTPWDLIAYCEVWCRQARVSSKGGLANTVERVFTKLREQLPANRQAQLDALYCLVYQHLHWQPTKSRIV